MNCKIVYIELLHSLNVLAVIVLYPVLIIVSIIYTIVKFMNNKNRDKTISGQVAVITGSGRGLGREIAIELAKRGCHIAIVDIQGNLAEETSKYIAEQYNVKSKAYKIDVTDYQQLVELKNKVTADLGDTTILINNAGILLLSSLENPSPKEIQQMVNVNFTSHIFAHQIFMPKMKELNKGHVVTISSISAVTPIANAIIYSATKAAVRSLSTTLRMEVMDENKDISVTTVLPFFLTTNKRVDKLIQLSHLPKTLPSIDGDIAAKYVVNAMLNGEREITAPYTFLYGYKLLELLPFCVKDAVGAIFGKLGNSVFATTEGKNILATRDVL